MTEKTEREKPEGWKEALADLIFVNLSYEDTNKALKEEFGEVGAISGADYQAIKNKILGGTKVDEKIDDLGKKKRPRKEKKLAAWTKQKQHAADTSQLAQIINAGVYQGLMPFCAKQELEEAHVQAINPGGAVVASISYYFPETKLEHPLVMLGIRVVILYIKFKSMCGRMQGGKKGGLPFGTPQDPGKGSLKPGKKTDVRS